MGSYLDVSNDTYLQAYQSAIQRNLHLGIYLFNVGTESIKTMFSATRLYINSSHTTVCKLSSTQFLRPTKDLQPTWPRQPRKSTGTNTAPGFESKQKSASQIPFKQCNSKVSLGETKDKHQRKKELTDSVGILQVSYVLLLTSCHTDAGCELPAVGDSGRVCSVSTHASAVASVADFHGWPKVGAHT